MDDNGDNEDNEDKNIDEEIEIPSDSVVAKEERQGKGGRGGVRGLGISRR